MTNGTLRVKREVDSLDPSISDLHYLDVKTIIPTNRLIAPVKSVSLICIITNALQTEGCNSVHQNEFNMYYRLTVNNYSWVSVYCTRVIRLNQPDTRSFDWSSPFRNFFEKQLKENINKNKNILEKGEELRRQNERKTALSLYVGIWALSLSWFKICQVISAGQTERRRIKERWR